jgi:alanine racemase
MEMENESGFSFRAVLSLKARVVLVRRLPAGTDISYSRTYTLDREATIATVAIGYGDGYPRRFSNCGAVLLPSGALAPIRGRVCMDQLCIEVSDSEELAVGDTVTLIGDGAGGALRVSVLAEQIDCTPHELTTCLTPRVPRIGI